MKVKNIEQNKPTNSIVEHFKSVIGKEINNSPSPIASWLKGIVREVEIGSLVVDFKVRKDMTNPIGILHGGTIAMIMDDMIGATVYTLDLNKFYVTVNLSVNYLDSSGIGEIITAKTKVLRSGKTLINAECELYNSERNLLAKGSSNLIITK